MFIADCIYHNGALLVHALLAEYCMGQNSVGRDRNFRKFDLLATLLVSSIVICSSICVFLNDNSVHCPCYHILPSLFCNWYVILSRHMMCLVNKL